MLLRRSSPVLPLALLSLLGRVALLSARPSWSGGRRKWRRVQSPRRRVLEELGLHPVPRSAQLLAPPRVPAVYQALQAGEACVCAHASLTVDSAFPRRVKSGVPLLRCIPAFSLPAPPPPPASRRALRRRHARRPLHIRSCIARAACKSERNALSFRCIR